MRFHIAFISIFFTTLLNSQNEDVKFGKVTNEEVAHKTHTSDPDAEAAILYKKERLFYTYNSDKGFLSTREMHLRIKVYKKAGLNWATIIIPLYDSGTANQKVYGIKGYTYNLAGQKVTEDKLRNTGIFTENINKYRNQVSITMPGVKEGSVIDLEYVIGSNLVGYMDPFITQYGIPVNYVNINVEIPEYFNFKKHIKGFYPVKLEESTTNKTANFQYKEVTRTTDYTAGIDSHHRGSLDYTESHYSIKAENIPALREEDFTDNINNYRSAVVFELESTKFPSEGYRVFSQSWDDVADAIYKYDDFGGELNKTRAFEKDIDILIEKYKNKKELAAAIFYFVQNRMSWDGFYSVGCEKGIKNSYEQRKGNVADINLMLTAMLQYAGIDANPVLVSTKDHGIPLFPTTDGFNYVVSAIESNDNCILMDATEKILSVNELPVRAINWTGRLVRKDGTSKSISLIPENASAKTIFMNAQISKDGNVTGEMRTRLTNNLAYDYRKSSIGKSNEELKDYVSSLNSSITIDDFETENVNKLSAPITETFSFIKDGPVDIIGERLYFSPMLFLMEQENPFKMQKREYPIDFRYPKTEKINISFKIPDGYKVESLPENLAIGLPDNYGVFNYNLKAIGNTIQLVSLREINSALVPPIFYTPLKEFYKQIVQKHNEKIVLSKI